ncbi:Hypothetical protein NTJ_09277 [Nesidiocoris tenuis]|uniref:Uncharacterized protein n=1 Tax=Nesidiocoris tenuis TaxID=355587 RepID=A0ABN7AZY3_9HEMI|nr:Hypothetical protein NTJ_09277 [Nesidiocoris tenuis]
MGVMLRFLNYCITGGPRPARETAEIFRPKDARPFSGPLPADVISSETLPADKRCRSSIGFVRGHQWRAKLGNCDGPPAIVDKGPAILNAPLVGSAYPKLSLGLRQSASFN